MKIKTKMMTAFGLLITLIFASVMVVLSFIVKNSIEEDLEAQLTSTTNALSAQVEGFIQSSSKNYLRAIAEQNRNLMEKSDLPFQEVIDSFGHQKIGTSGYTYVLDTEGVIISHPDSSKIGKTSSLASTLKGKTDFEDEYLAYDYQGREKILYRTYYAPKQLYISVTAYADELVDLIDLESLKEQVLAIKIGNDGYPSVFTTANEMIIHPALKAGTDLSGVNDADGNPIFSDMIDQKEGMIYYNWTEKDGSVRKKFLSFTTMDSPDWVIVSSGYNSDYFALLFKINSVLLILSFISVALIILIVYILSGFLVRSIVSTTNLLKNISEGDGDLTRKLEITSRDETGLMAGYFNSFTSKLAELINHVKQTSIKSVEIKEDLSANLEETVSSISQIDTNLQNVNNRMKEMDGKINHSTDAVNQIIGGIENLDNRIQEQSGAVEESTASVTEMVASLKNVSSIVARRREAAEELVQTSKNGSNHIGQTKETFQKGISTRISQISEMTSIIENIAAQTNLLSMNAAIEAAHAGDAGRGFAVVADEIRKLAEESTENSKKISDVIKSIVQYIEKTGRHVEQTSNAFESIESEIHEMDMALAEILSASDELSAGGEQVLSAMTILADISTNVSSKSSEIRDNSSIVSEVINEVSDISGNVADAVDEAAMGTAEISQNMLTSQNLLSSLSDATIQVNHQVARFKTTA